MRHGYAVRCVGLSGFGLAVLCGRAVVTPWVGLSRSETSETLRLGQRLKLGRASEWRIEGTFGEAERGYSTGYGYRLGQSLDVTLDAVRREAAYDEPSAHELMLRMRKRWLGRARYGRCRSAIPASRAAFRAGPGRGRRSRRTWECERSEQFGAGTHTTQGR